MRWVLAANPTFTRVVARGETPTGAARDFTVKIDVSGLSAATTYYYRFEALGARSAIGRTRTLPAAGAGRVRLALASCANYPHGYFNVYGRIAARPDIDAVLHLGDYFYEYRAGPLPRQDADRSRSGSAARDHRARRLPAALRALSHRPRPAGGAPAASVHRGVGRPRDRQQHLEHRRRQSPAGRRRLHRPPQRRLPGVPGMAAGTRHRVGAPAAHLPLVRLRRSRRPGDARHPPGRPRRPGRAHQRARHRGPAPHASSARRRNTGSTASCASRCGPERAGRSSASR